MSWFSKLFQKGPKNQNFAKTMDGFLPIYSQFGTNIYASDVVQQALKCIVNEMKKRVITMNRGVIISDETEGGYDYEG